MYKAKECCKSRLVILCLYTRFVSFLQVKVWFQNRRMKWRHAQQQQAIDADDNEPIVEKNQESPETTNTDNDSVQKDNECIPMNVEEDSDDDDEEEEDVMLEEDFVNVNNKNDTASDHMGIK